MHLVLVTLLAFLMSSCMTSYLAKNLYLVSFSKSSEQGEEIGVVKEDSCGIRVLGFGPPANLNRAMTKLRSREEIRYIKHMRIERKYRSYGFWDRDCWHVRGIAFK